MILTLTPNPSLDLLFRAERLVWDDANRIPMPRRRAGGQGINVVRAVRALEPTRRTRAIAPLGGAVGDEIRLMLEAEGTLLTTVPIDGDTRVFVGVRETETGRAMLLNPRGPTVGPGDGDRLLEALDRELERAGAAAAAAGRPPGWLACCGSILPGLDTALYARAGRLARGRGFRFVPDCDGPALAEAVDAGCDLLVPNVHEAERLVGGSLRSADDAARAARELMRRGPATVAITLGADGAVAADATGTWHALPDPPLDARSAMEAGSAVGAGDAFLAGLLLALDAGRSLPRALTAAVAAGSAVLLSRDDSILCADDAKRTARHIQTRALAGG